MIFGLLRSLTGVVTFRVNKRLYKLFWATALFFFSIFIGISGFRIIEGWDYIDAFYMTVITIGTVGFQEVHPLSETGRLFTAVYIILNLGIFALFASVITSYLFEGELREVFTNYLTYRKVKSLNNHIILCGFGKNGQKACEEFMKNKIPFVVIENSEKLIKENLIDLQGRPEMHFIEGDATHDDILKLAGVDRARALITTLPSDADSVFVTLTARQLNPKIRIIARANESSSESKLISAGADKLVRPDMIGGTYMANLVTRPAVVDFLDMIGGTGTLKLEEFEFEDFKENYKGKSIIDQDVRNKTGAHIMGFKDADKGFLINPHPATLISEGDVIIVLGEVKQILDFAHYYTRKKLKDIRLS